ncbi:hypothetical protein [Thalassospira xiamenensis]|uniref:Uncharacterized protein n=1 Tax=Thalassospira xiamenensis TaxID=220697 RepID=A0A367XK92_9PROT|nr:hypothetical protein [Thalassospira xiamenensis]KZB51136.1 hypothetical protein AUP41_08505 [Thalassospira xiamenensis]RCK53211.1 hypothetical protein TH44_03200 [Thalassospira xiamenensis]
MEYVNPIGKTGGATYVDGNPEADIEGDAVSAKAWEHPMREIVNTINYYLGTVENPLPASAADLQQLRKAIQQAVTDGTSDALRRTVSATLGAGFWTTRVEATVDENDNLLLDAAAGNRWFVTATGPLTITAPTPMPAGGSAQLELTMDNDGNHGIAWGPEYSVNHGQIDTEPGAFNRIHMEFSGAVIDVHITQRAGA